MERKKYQVFVSSTYEDLREERANVMQTLLEMDCIPSGMELFSAADESQWELIKDVINECDYFVLILGGCYGSVDSNGTSFTEKEYRYAIEKNKPTIGFLHKDPSTISNAKTEKSEKGKKKLEDFRKYVSKKLCDHWLSADELGARVSRSVMKLQKRSPANGWIRANMRSSIEANEEILLLREKNVDLKNRLKLFADTEKIAIIAADKFRSTNFFLMGKPIPGVTYFKFLSPFFSVPQDTYKLINAIKSGLKSYGNEVSFSAQDSLADTIGTFNILGLVEINTRDFVFKESHNREGDGHSMEDLKITTIVKPTPALSNAYNLLADDPVQFELLANPTRAC